MALTTMKEDLLNEFREERIMINKQVELLEPLANSFRQPAARRLINSGILLLVELSCYLLSLGCIASLFTLMDLYPFTILRDVFNNPMIKKGFTANDLTVLNLTIYGIGALLGILLFSMGRMARVIRQKNSILNIAGKDITTIVEQSLVRMAAIDTIEQRHYMDISGINFVNNSPSVMENQSRPQKITVNEVFNPGYSR